MFDFSTLAPLVLVLGCSLAFGANLSSSAFGRWLAAGMAMAILARYLAWRVPAAWPVAEGGGVEAAWALACLVFETLIVMDGLLGFFILARRRDRSSEADRYVLELRAEAAERLPAVDVFIPTYNEDLDVLERTIVGAAAIDYPRFKVWVLDDGRRAWVAELCRRKGVGYLTRPDNSHAKAGNINHALTVTSADLVAVFDADFVPRRDFLWRTVGFFRDPKVGIVQTPQHFFNPDPVQLNLGVDRWLPEEQRFFFTVLQPSRDAFDAAFCCGSNAVLRRSALALIGGIPTASVTEDILATLALLRHGFVTRYLNERLAVGLSPETTQAYFVQRRRWCRGGVQLLFLKDGPLGPGLSLVHRLLFLPSYWVLQLPSRLFLLLVPLVFLWTGMVPLQLDGVEEFVLYPVTTAVACAVAFMRLAPGAHVPIVTDAIYIFMALRLAPTAIATLIKPFGEPFRVTPKGKAAGDAVFDRANFVAASMLFGFTLVGMLRHQIPLLNSGTPAEQLAVGSIWPVLNCVILLIVMSMSFAVPRRRGEERFPWRTRAKIRLVRGEDLAAAWHEVVTDNVSMSGAAVTLPDETLSSQDQVEVELPGVGLIRATVVRRAAARLHVQFEPLSEAAADALVRQLYTSGLVNGAQGEIDLRELARSLFLRLFAPERRS